MVVNAGTLTLTGPIGLSTTARPFEFGGAGNGFVNGAINNAGIALRKVDAGTWTFKASNTHTNVTTIEAGTLALGPAGGMPNTLSINVFSNATFDVSQPRTFNLGTSQALLGSGAINGSIGCSGADTIMAGSNNAPGTLTFSNNLSLNGTSTLFFNLGTATTAGSGVNSFIQVLGNLDPESANLQINPIAPLTSPGTYPIISYGSESSLFNSTISAAGTRYVYSLSDNGVSQISLNVAGGPTNLVWPGASSGGLWDITNTVNWNAGSQKFYNGDNVVFNDTGSGSVNVGVTLQPGSVLFTNLSVNYTLSGSGKISGYPGLTKSGSGILAISTSSTGHNYTGLVTVNGGTLTVSNVALNGSASALGAGTNIILNGGTPSSSAAPGPQPALSIVIGPWVPVVAQSFPLTASFSFPIKFPVPAVSPRPARCKSSWAT